MDARVIHECTRLAFENKMTFPETVKRLMAIGVERYYADLLLLQKTYYGTSGATHVEPLPLHEAPKVGEVFELEKVKDAIHAIQQRQIDYAQFLRRIMTAGAVCYSVFLDGKKAIYTGRRGDFHVEQFPNNA
jgi:uncharacterized protein YbcV (DUF1398 family)